MDTARNNPFLRTRTIHMLYKFAAFVVLTTVAHFNVYGQDEAIVKQKYVIAGFVKDQSSKEALFNSNVYIERLSVGTTSNKYGFFSLVFEASANVLDSLAVSISFAGYETLNFSYKVERGQTTHEFDLVRKTNMLDEVVVRSSTTNNLTSQNPQMSLITLSTDIAKLSPTLLGEKDMLKTLQLMPGVQKASEGSTGIYVRGGGLDQNLIILDEATVYNASHLFGFFSIFNGNAIKDMTLYKGGFPARYGGRLSSVIDVQMREGNKQETHAEASLGLVAANLTVEGPLSRGKTSYLISARRSYLDLLTKFSFNGGSSSYYFQDFAVKVNHEFSSKDKIYLSAYTGRDKGSFGFSTAQIPSTGSINWGNITTTFRWNHLFSRRFFANTSLVYSRYRYNVAAQEGSFIAKYSSGIKDVTAKMDIDYVLSARSIFKAGLLWTNHIFTPESSVQQVDTSKLVAENNIKADEFGVYLEHSLQLTRLKINTGFRLSGFVVDGKTYVRPEPRFSGLYSIKSDLAIKVSFAQMNQYVQLLSNSGIGLPTDLWVPTTKRLAPQQGYQIAAGIVKDLKSMGSTLTIESYYKKSRNIIAYKQGSNAFVLDGPQGLINERKSSSWENQVVTGKGWSYGAELLLQKHEGRFTGWLGYTVSWTQQQFDSLNNGQKFWAKNDRRHDVSLVGFYRLKSNITLTAIWVYSSGNLFTLPTASLALSLPELDPSRNASVLNASTFTERNNFRAEAYHRMDIGCQFNKRKLKWNRVWEIGVYNIYNHLNPFIYKTVAKSDQSVDANLSLHKVSLFPIIPSVSYKIIF